MTEVAQASVQSPRETVSRHRGVAHVMHPLVLLAVWIVLLGLTVATVAVTYVDLGSFNLIIAMGIATVKAALVALFFMHLLYDRPFNAVVFVTALLVVSLFIVMAILDTTQYQPGLIPGYAPGLTR